jgi:hypothetical protein
MLAYALTVFLGAFLLFQVQPLMGKYLLPWFGGGPSVWTTCLFFFQSFLVGGYAYAHALTRFFRPRMQILVHLLLLATALASLPIVPSLSWKPNISDNPTAAILVLLTCNLGIPYLALAATGPLLQQWYSRSVLGTSPYPLYALSNFGSLLALLTYPVLFEAHLSRKLQALFWEWGFVVYVLCCGCCAILGTSAACRRVEQPSTSESIAETQRHGNLRLLWVLWPACASVLLIATTNKLCLDVAVFPLLWVLPLAAYLASFVLCFAGSHYYPRLFFLLALGVAMTGFAWALFTGAGWPFWKQVCVYTGGLFVCCMVCHGELFRIRPAPRSLTEFYLLIAVGGALGGLFAAVIAPRLFTNYYELHWGLVFVGLLVVATRTSESIRTIIEHASITPPDLDKVPSPIPRRGANSWAGFDMASLWLSFFAMAAVLWLQARSSNNSIVYRSRNFYGVLTVFENRKEEPTGHHFLLRHGRITHGFQFVHPDLRLMPTTYYGPESGLGLALKTLPGKHRRIGVVGLGTGTIAAYANPGDSFNFYEINPQVIHLATSRFTYLADCLGTWQITPGDARLAVERQNPQNFDLIALDAFNSDSIPVHLLTREGFSSYLRHLKPDGILAVHISNHFLNLEPVVTGLAHDCGLHFAVIDHDAKPEQWWIYSSTWVLLARNEKILDLQFIRDASKSSSGSGRANTLWTDDYSSLFQILR